MKYQSSVLILSLSIFHISYAPVPSFGSCPNIRGRKKFKAFYTNLWILLIFHISGIPNFDRNKYLGSWYEYANVFEFYQVVLSIFILSLSFMFKTFIILHIFNSMFRLVVSVYEQHTLMREAESEFSMKQ